MTTAIGLVNPKYPHNVGAVIRSASCYNVPRVLWSGKRVTFDRTTGERLPREERMRGYSEVERVMTERMWDETSGLTPVAVEVTDKSENLIYFEHPENAFYVFGPEDGSLARVHLGQCHRFVTIPSRHCLNLATAVTTVLFHRHMQRVMLGLEQPHTVGPTEGLWEVA